MDSLNSIDEPHPRFPLHLNVERNKGHLFLKIHPLISKGQITNKYMVKTKIVIQTTNHK
jgi:hypothetical protein